MAVRYSINDSCSAVSHSTDHASTKFDDGCQQLRSRECEYGGPVSQYSASN